MRKGNALTIKADFFPPIGRVRKPPTSASISAAVALANSEAWRRSQELEGAAAPTSDLDLNNGLQSVQWDEDCRTAEQQQQQEGQHVHFKTAVVTQKQAVGASFCFETGKKCVRGQGAELCGGGRPTSASAHSCVNTRASFPPRQLWLSGASPAVFSE